MRVKISTRFRFRFPGLYFLIHSSVSERNRVCSLRRTFLVLAEVARLLLDRSEVVVVGETVEFGAVDVGDPTVAADRQHVLVVFVGRSRAAVRRSGDDDRIFADAILGILVGDEGQGESEEGDAT
jgi:hypothetical protein